VLHKRFCTVTRAHRYSNTILRHSNRYIGPVFTSLLACRTILRLCNTKPSMSARRLFDARFRSERAKSGPGGWSTSMSGPVPPKPSTASRRYRRAPDPHACNTAGCGRGGLSRCHLGRGAPRATVGTPGVPPPDGLGYAPPLQICAKFRMLNEQFCRALGSNSMYRRKARRTGRMRSTALLMTMTPVRPK
jgi:hypothetical protein